MKAQRMVLMEVKKYEIKSLALILVKQTQNLAWVCIIIVIMVIYLLIEKKFLSLTSLIEISTFQLNFF